MRAQLPSDILVIDWHYAEAAASEFKSLKVWNDLGFDCIAGTGNTPANILPFAQAVTKQIEAQDENTTQGKSLGMVVTTWAGRNFNIEAMNKFVKAVQSYVLGAEAAWTGGYEKATDVPFDYVSEFENIWNKSVLPDTATKGWTVDLTKAKQSDNRTMVKMSFASLKAAKDKSWLGYMTGDDLSKLPVGKQTFDRFVFDLPSDNTALLLAGQMDKFAGSHSISLPCDGKKASVINFMTAATEGGPTSEAIATTYVQYEDGTEASFDWNLGNNVYAISDENASINTPLIWKDGKDDTLKCIHSFCWQNPEPDKAIKNIKTVSNKKSAGLLIFAITGVEAED